MICSLNERCQNDSLFSWSISLKC